MFKLVETGAADVYRVVGTEAELDAEYTIRKSGEGWQIVRKRGEREIGGGERYASAQEALEALERALAPEG